MTRTRPSHRLLLALCAFALLVAQMLGALHRIEHAGHGHLPSLSLVTMSKAPSFLKSLFGAHDSAGACDIYDQAGHDAGPWSTPVVAVAPGFDLPPAEVHRTWHLAAQSAGFLARGPPTI